MTTLVGHRLSDLQPRVLLMVLGLVLLLLGYERKLIQDYPIWRDNNRLKRSDLKKKND